MTGGAFGEAAAALGAVALAGFAVGRAVPVPRRPLERYVRARLLRMAARAAAALAVVALGIGAFGGRPLAVTAGAVVGWLLVAGWEARALAARRE
ncbi:MAG: hypothetical protein KBD01_12130 [Acidobacteria bacterium]|nr:hypothetical protein [Acidobacteriota bacterium]